MMKGVLSTIVFYIALPAFSATKGVEDLAKKVIELRREVEELNAQYEMRKQQVVEELKGLATQKTELSAGINEAELKEQQLLQKMVDIKKHLKQKSALGEDLNAVNNNILSFLREYIITSLPYQREQRNSSLQQLEEKVKTGEISPTTVTNLLWGLLADEKRLARETSLAKQNISLEGKELLAEVVKVGMVAMYFKIDEGKVGQVVQSGNEWKYKEFSQKWEQEKVLLLFDSIKKQIRNGFFELPLSLEEKG